MVAVMFPGQGSQSPGMGRALAEDPVGRLVFDEVSQTLGRDVAKLCLESDEETLRRTENAQVALYVTSVAAYRRFMAAALGLSVSAAAGHSVGEYAALTAAGVLSVSEGARLVAERGRIMAASGRSRPGTMAAVLGLDREVVENCCSEVEGVCVVANDNCPGQLVVSGDVAAVESASAALKEAGAKRVLPLSVSGAFHSPLMEEPAKEMGAVLAGATFDPGSYPVFSNVTADPGSSWPELLQRQLESPVRWTESITNIAATGVRTFVECGHGAVLSGLVKRIVDAPAAHTVTDPDSADAAATALSEVAR